MEKFRFRGLQDKGGGGGGGREGRSRKLASSLALGEKGYPNAGGTPMLAEGPGGPEAPFTLEMYCWQIICSPTLTSRGFRVMKMPRP